MSRQSTECIRGLRPKKRGAPRHWDLDLSDRDLRKLQKPAVRQGNIDVICQLSFVSCHLSVVICPCCELSATDDGPRPRSHDQLISTKAQNQVQALPTGLADSQFQAGLHAAARLPYSSDALCGGHSRYRAARGDNKRSHTRNRHTCRHGIRTRWCWAHLGFKKSCAGVDNIRKTYRAKNFCKGRKFVREERTSAGAVSI